MMTRTYIFEFVQRYKISANEWNLSYFIPHVFSDCERRQIINFNSIKHSENTDRYCWIHPKITLEIRKRFLPIVLFSLLPKRWFSFCPVSDGHLCVSSPECTNANRLTFIINRRLSFAEYRNKTIHFLDLDFRSTDQLCHPALF